MNVLLGGGRNVIPVVLYLWIRSYGDPTVQFGLDRTLAFSCPFM